MHSKSQSEDKGQKNYYINEWISRALLFNEVNTELRGL